MGDRSDLKTVGTLSLLFNTRHRIVICEECGFEVKKWQNHVKNFHPHRHRDITNEDVACVNLLFEESSENVPRSIDQEPIQGLPIISGFQCTSCDLLTSSSSVQKRHHCSSKRWSDVQIQRMSHKNPWFKVSEADFFHIQIKKFTKKKDKD